ncbi:hypothetical protein [Catenulispora rubra]|uniref:hypothetical protein n=1 Tax=Catenulispora rubra TaxID=280293 RepID=UPI0018924EDB|nr:hypothetical protein [Catenulispora rubra]
MGELLLFVPGTVGVEVAVVQGAQFQDCFGTCRGSTGLADVEAGFDQVAAGVGELLDPLLGQLRRRRRS